MKRTIRQPEHEYVIVMQPPVGDEMYVALRECGPDYAEERYREIDAMLPKHWRLRLQRHEVWLSFTLVKHRANSLRESEQEGYKPPLRGAPKALEFEEKLALGDRVEVRVDVFDSDGQTAREQWSRAKLLESDWPFTFAVAGPSNVRMVYKITDEGLTWRRVT